jgi:hypothetical protein
MIGTPVVLTPAVKLPMFPELPEDKLIAVLLFVQLNVTPPSATFEPKIVAGTVPPEQTTILPRGSTTGVGLIVIVNVLLLLPELVQPLAVADTVIVPTISEPVLLTGAVPVIVLPETGPAGKPIEVLELDQLMVAAPTLLLNGIEMVSPAQ